MTREDSHERELQESLAILSGLARSTPVGLYIVQDGKFRWVNSRFEEITEYQEEDLIGTSSLGYVHPDDRNTVRANAVAALKNDCQSPCRPYQYRVVCKSGRLRWIAETVASIEFRGRRATLGNFMDVTEKRQAEELYAAVVDNSPECIYVSQEDRIVFANAWLQSTTGHSRSQLLGTDPVLLVHPEDRRIVSQNTDDMIRGWRLEPFEFRFVTKSGETRWALQRVVRVDLRGQEAALAISTDITERKNAATALQKAEEAAEAAGRAKTELRGRMSNEIRAPVKTIVDLSGLALRTELQPRQREYLGRIQSAANSLMGIVGDIRHPSGIEAGKLGIEGARVLIVDDNELSQQATRENLESCGLVVEVAADGRQAVNALGSFGSLFDAVLMDLQMPDMDGFEATRLIRANHSRDNLPIIAMMADAPQSQIQRCLSEGMNDYVAKPINPEALRAVLVRWVKPPPGDGTVSPAGTTVPRSTQPTTALPGIDVPLALKRLMGNRRLLDRLLRDFVRDCGGAGGRIARMVHGGDYAAAAGIVHNMRAVAGNLGASALFDATVALESTLRAQDKTRIDEAILRLEETVSIVIQSAARLLPEGQILVRPSPVDDQTVADAAEMTRPIVELDALLKNNNLSAVKQFDELAQRLAGTEMEVQLRQMRTCIDRLDYREARRHLEAVAHRLGVLLT